MSEKKPIHFMVHSAVTIMGQKGFSGRFLPGGKPEYIEIVPDKEICQFAAEFPHKQLPERYFREAFRQMEEACLAKAVAAGLITHKG